MKPMAEAYYSRGEPLYDDMMVLFGLEDVKEEEISISVVNLVDDKNSDDKFIEVTSPPFNAACRRLFDGPSTSFARPVMNPCTTDNKNSPKHSRCSSTSTSLLMWWKA